MRHVLSKEMCVCMRVCVYVYVFVCVRVWVCVCTPLISARAEIVTRPKSACGTYSSPSAFATRVIKEFAKDVNLNAEKKL